MGSVSNEFVIGLTIGVFASAIHPFLGLLLLALVMYAIYSESKGRRRSW